MDRPGFLDDLVLGSLRWDLLCPFPVQEPADRSCGDRAIADLGRLLDPVDAEAIDRHGILPGNLVDELRRHGFLALAGPPPHGSGLSPYNIFRAIDAAATASPPLALLMAIANGLGAAAYRSALPAGPLRDQLDRWVSAGVVSGTADTEPAGAGNSGRTTVALAVEDGTAYRLFGDKVFIGNAPVADVLAVSATVRECGHDQVRLFFVETHSPEFESYAGHEFLGLRGTPNGAIRLNGVRVPREHMLPVTGEWRDQP
jgi:alkylation response protein AidB-like acyl-CoA dehydrogenase